MSGEQPPPYTEATKGGDVNYGSTTGGQPQGYAQGPAMQQGYPPGAYQGPGPQQGYPAGAYQGPGPQQGYAPAGAYQGYPGGGGGYDQPKYTPAGAVPAYQGYNIIQPQTQVVMVGGCPACRVGVLEDDFTCLGVFCAIMFFPLGILCCLAMRQRRCANCGAVFG